MASVRTSLVLVLCTFLRIFQSSYGDGNPCTDYKSISDPYRSSKYKLVAGEKANCDEKLAPGWYRFTNKVGGKMSTTKPEPRHCGTVAPIWMKGTHPTTNGEVTQALACTNINNRLDGCMIAKPMSVKNCGRFFVYNLQPSGGCAMAYCAGNLLPCPRGQIGIVPNCRGSVISPFPFRLVPEPTITYLEDNKSEVTMQCHFQFPLWKNVSFHVEWFTDGFSVKNHTICEDQDPDNEVAPACSIRKSGLPHDHYRTGDRIHCRLRMKYTTNPQNTWTTFWRESDVFFVGIEELKPPTEMGDNLCPGACSNHGNCTSRTCICEEGYTSADCSMLINAIPELLSIYDEGLCDIRQSPCKQTDIFGHDFISSENLTCHVQEIKVVEGNWSVRPHHLKYPGEMIDIFGVRCNLPDPPTKLGDYDNEGTPAGGLLVSVSNDGEQRSKRQKRFVSYDSMCVACTNSSSCQARNDSCQIGGHCFPANESHPRDWCLQCLPEHSVSSWTPRKGNQSSKFTVFANQSAVKGEYLQIQLNATYPDNRPVTYSLISSTAAGYTFSPPGLLNWNVTSQNNPQFEFKVTNECNASDTITITIDILPCPCQNAAKCLPNPYHPRGSGQYYCSCPQGFTGDRCENNMDDCAAVSCGNGTCVDGVNNHTCRCHPGFAGSLCDQRLTHCTNQTCFPGVLCTEIPNGISCGPCSVGFSGDGKTCVVPALPTTRAPSTTPPHMTTVATTTAPPTTTVASTTTPPTTTNTSPTTTTAPPSTTATAPTVTTAQPTTTTAPPTTTTAPSTTTTAPPTTTTAAPTTTTAPSTITSAAPKTSTPTTVASTITGEPLVNKTSTEESLTTTQIPGAIPTTNKSPQIVKLCEIRILEDWVEGYSNVRSEVFRVLSSLLWKEIWASFVQDKNNDLTKVVVTKFRKGSIIAEFDLVFKTEPESDLLKPIRERIKDGKLGELDVDKDSLGLRDKKLANEEPKPKDKDSLVLVVVLVLIAILVVIIIVVVVVIIYKRKQKRTRNLQQIRNKNREEDGEQGEMLPLTEKNSSK